MAEEKKKDPAIPRNSAYIQLLISNVYSAAVHNTEHGQRMVYEHHRDLISVLEALRPDPVLLAAIENRAISKLIKFARYSMACNVEISVKSWGIPGYAYVRVLSVEHRSVVFEETRVSGPPLSAASTFNGGCHEVQLGDARVSITDRSIHEKCARIARAEELALATGVHPHLAEHIAGYILPWTSGVIHL